MQQGVKLNTGDQRDRRTNLLMRVRIRCGGPERDASILDASATGLLMTADPPPNRGDIVEVFIGRQVLVGQVRWAKAPRFGVVLRERIDVGALIGHNAGPLTAAARRPQPKAAEPEPARRFRFYDVIFLLAALVASVGFLARFFNG